MINLTGGLCCASSPRDVQQQDGYDHRQHGKNISSAQTEPSDGVDALTKLCRILSCYNRNGSTRDTSFDSFPPKLVKLLKHDTDPDVILLSARVITYLCEKIPELAGLFVSLDALPVLCQRLHTFEYQEVAEQCIQALEEISLQQPIACLKAGATMSILNSIDFFSTKIQRVAVSIVERIYLETLHFESPVPLVCVEAIPILCNLLQYEDPQLVEKVVSCLIMTVKYCAAKSPEILDEFCADGLIEKVIHLLSLTNQSQRALSPLIYTVSKKFDSLFFPSSCGF
ncbi:E3 ubiquitin-protein ligase UPL3, putative [Medicago truncatula]|uniref:HECT-type E3 ubiquitin transferase n=1 Tax=Medicago truncatula TaxID=3880 RepID=G7L1Q3_MEDTR|nr:E3 ubiquitin-protein ligase UPL3, putative [Medicago truncatula]